VNDVPLSFSFREPKRKKSFGARFVLNLYYNVDRARFGLLQIRSFLKRVTNYELMPSQNAREYRSMFFCGSMSKYIAGYPE
jgi:hypothetical protein